MSSHSHEDVEHSKSLVADSFPLVDNIVEEHACINPLHEKDEVKPQRYDSIYDFYSRHTPLCDHEEASISNANDMEVEYFDFDIQNVSVKDGSMSMEEDN